MEVSSFKDVFSFVNDKNIKEKLDQDLLSIIKFNEVNIGKFCFLCYRLLENLCHYYHEINFPNEIEIIEFQKNSQNSTFNSNLIKEYQLVIEKRSKISDVESKLQEAKSKFNADIKNEDLKKEFYFLKNKLSNLKDKVPFYLQKSFMIGPDENEEFLENFRSKYGIKRSTISFDLKKLDSARNYFSHGGTISKMDEEALKWINNEKKLNVFDKHPSNIPYSLILRRTLTFIEIVKDKLNKDNNEENLVVGTNIETDIESNDI